MICSKYATPRYIIYSRTLSEHTTKILCIFVHECLLLLYLITKKWNHFACISKDEWIKESSIYNGILFSHKE